MSKFEGAYADIMKGINDIISTFVGHIDQFPVDWTQTQSFEAEHVAISAINSRRWLDDQEIFDGYTTANYENYTFTIPTELEELYDVRIVFDNDAVINGEDRNLYVKSIELIETIYDSPSTD